MDVRLSQKALEERDQDAAVPLVGPPRKTPRAFILKVMDDDSPGGRVQAIERARHLEAEYAAEEALATKRLEELDMLWNIRREPLAQHLEAILKERQSWARQILVLENPELEDSEEQPIAPGPQCLHCVDGFAFVTICNVVVALNLASMFAKLRYPGLNSTIELLDHVFLLWYVGELAVKVAYHRRQLFIGRLSTVWWNWMDAGIVVGGIIDQWILPLVTLVGTSGSGVPFMNGTFLRSLRFLRLFRVMRILKLLRYFILADMIWVTGPAFESFISCVIMVNALVMGLELDCPWDGWKFVEQAFICIYVFELLLKMKRWGAAFFWEADNMMWNILDFIIVCGGVLDLWLLPLLAMTLTELTGHPQKISSEQLGNCVTILRLLRLLRVLRLVRLLRSIKPLYRLCIGVIEALSAMKWVMILTLLVLYAAAIFFTTLVGKGEGYGGKPPSAEAHAIFASVPQSLFSLFRLMNGDTEVVDPITTTAEGRLLFAGFMVLANWAILAILTSVVSDNMIAASTKTIQEDEEKMHTEREVKRKSCLLAIFREMDPHGTGYITEVQFRKALTEPASRKAICEASGIAAPVVLQLFIWMSSVGHVMPEEVVSGSEASTADAESALFMPKGAVNYEQFVEFLRDEARPADKRSQLQLAQQLKALENMIDTRFEQMKLMSPPRVQHPWRND